MSNKQPTMNAGSERQLRLADAAMSQGRLDEAERICRQILAQAPHSAPALHTLGLVVFAKGRRSEGVALVSRAILLQDGAISYRRNLCELYRRMGQLDDAIRIGEQAVALAPNDSAAHFNLGIVWASKGDRAREAACYRRVIELDPSHDRAWNNLGAVLGITGDDAGALDAYLRAARLNPKHAQAHCNAGTMLGEQGRIEEARKYLEAAIAIQPAFFEAHKNLSALKKYTAEDPHVALLEQYGRQAERIAPEQRMILWFVLGKLREDLGQYDSAFAAYAEGNRLKRSRTAYDEAAQLGMFERATGGHTREALAANDGQQDATPVFVVGMPRSGTTLVEQVVASHPMVHGAGELLDFERALNRAGVNLSVAAATGLDDAAWRAIGADYLQTLRRHDAAAPRIVDKLPMNFFYLGAIRRALPNAKIIHVMRDPLDTCWSIYGQLFSSPIAFAYNLGEIARYYNRYAALMRYWDDVLPAGSVLHVSYENLVSDLEGGTRRMLDFIGLPWDARCLDFHATPRTVKTASLGQVRQPAYSSSIGRWRRFEKHLGELQAQIEPGYPYGLL